MKIMKKLTLFTLGALSAAQVLPAATLGKVIGKNLGYAAAAVVGGSLGFVAGAVPSGTIAAGASATFDLVCFPSKRKWEIKHNALEIGSVAGYAGGLVGAFHGICKLDQKFGDKGARIGESLGIKFQSLTPRTKQTIIAGTVLTGLGAVSGLVSTAVKNYNNLDE